MTSVIYYCQNPLKSASKIMWFHSEMKVGFFWDVLPYNQVESFQRIKWKVRADYGLVKCWYLPTWLHISSTQKTTMWTMTAMKISRYVKKMILSIHFNIWFLSSKLENYIKILYWIVANIHHIWSILKFFANVQFYLLLSFTNIWTSMTHFKTDFLI